MIRGAAKGFTLIELMVSMAIGFLLLAGVFEMHAAFTRQSIHQQESADMQQALRVGAQVIGRGVRTAGAGLNGGLLDLYDGNTVPASWTLGGVQFSNTNAFPNNYPATIYDKVQGDTETADPDWIRIIAFDATPLGNGQPASAAPGCMTDGSCPTVVAVTSAPSKVGGANAIDVSDVRPFAQGSFAFVYSGDYSTSPSVHRVCARRVTNVPVANPDHTGTLVFDSGASAYNPAVAADTCMWTGPTALAQNFPAYKTAYVFGLDRSVIFRIQPGTNAAGQPKTPPKLQAWYASKPGTIPSFYPEAQANWQTLTENIEDMQIALVMNDGTVCGSLGNSIDDATAGAPGGPCQPQNVRATRFTLVARSSSPIPGWGIAGQALPAIEDETAIPLTDGYLRRVLTEEIQVRNIPWGGP